MELIGPLGADRRAGFQIKLRHFGGGPLALKDMLDGNSDFAVLGLPAMAGVALRHNDLRSIAVLTHAPAYTLMVRADLRGKVRKVADLRGMTLGVHAGSKAGKSTGQQVPEYLLMRAGVPLGEVNFVPGGQNYEDHAAVLASGSVDAIVTDEPSATRLAEDGIAWRLVDLHDPAVTRKHLGGPFIYTQVTARAGLLASQPDKVARLVRALRETLAWMHGQSPEAIARLVEPRDAASQALLARALRLVKPAYSADGAFSAEQLRTTETFFRAVSVDLPGAANLDFERLIDRRWTDAIPR
jgi:NitT/TauT family transport system substrate-binding protein